MLRGLPLSVLPLSLGYEEEHTRTTSRLRIPSNVAHTLGATMSDSRYGADAHNTDYERGREDERAAIVAWLLGNGLLHIAYTIESGEPLAGDDE